MVEGGPSPADTNSVEALGGFSMKLGSLLSTTGGATAKGVAWTSSVGAGGEGSVGAGGEGGVGVGSAGGEEGATLVLLVTRPSSVVSSSSSSSCTTWGVFLFGFLKINFFRLGAGSTPEEVAPREGVLP